jgi:hypothetical protein
VVERLARPGDARDNEVVERPHELAGRHLARWKRVEIYYRVCGASHTQAFNLIIATAILAPPSDGSPERTRPA